MKLGKKIILSICVILVLFLIGFGIRSYEKYNETEIGKTKIYEKELGDKINLEGNKTVIKIIKCNFNGNNYEDYIALIGEEKYDETNTDTSISKIDITKINSNLEMYNNVCIDYFDGENLEAKRYDTNKSYGVDVDIKFFEDTNRKYILLSDESTGNVALLTLKDGNISNIINDSFGNEFCGYTINASFSKEEPSKFKVVLDNYGRSYLAKKDEEYILDFEGTNVNKDNYRITYMANKYSKFNMEDVDNDGNLEFIGIQNLLYANNDTVESNVGKVKLIYKFNDEGKLSLQDIVVEK